MILPLLNAGVNSTETSGTNMDGQDTQDLSLPSLFDSNGDHRLHASLTTGMIYSVALPMFSR